ncbi:hypothetical protein IAQ61_008346 [Plenodomus lingam]|uniref:uncharacterized protein n=1 Tax=Leptosphaeria maculans TaxID=5022 RepID=UPI00332C3189|nr:hypothetical protein IAQ61_008346 [Plenodomus lingam]
MKRQSLMHRYIRTNLAHHDRYDTSSSGEVLLGIRQSSEVTMLVPWAPVERGKLGCKHAAERKIALLLIRCCFVL